MPTISRFFGITVVLYYNDHPPPHIHVFYQDLEAKVAIETGDVIEGRLPLAPLRILREWMQLRRSDLMENWRRVREHRPLERIPGADAG
jgi:hypothetical protein